MGDTPLGDGTARHSDLAALRLTRRAVLLSAAALPLAGCFGSDHVVKRIKIIAMAEVDGKPVKGSSVMEITWRPSGDRMYVDHLGEAVVLEMAGRGTVYVLPAVHLKSDMVTTGIWASQIGFHLGIRGAIKRQHLPAIAALWGRFRVLPFSDGTQFPLMVAFKDESEFRSVYRVEPEKFSSYFGDAVKFQGVEFEITDEPVTTGVLAKRLPVLLQPDKPAADFSFNRADGSSIPYVEWPFRYKIGQNTFFSPGRY